MKQCTTNCIWIILIWWTCTIQIYDSIDDELFRCKNGKYTRNRYFCDGDSADCKDNSDETYPSCYRSRCGSEKFFCSNACRNMTIRCNTLHDCDDGTDELNCGDEVNVNNCEWQNEKYLCDDKLRCLDFNYTCNNECNCFDCSDEKPDCLDSTEMGEYMKKVSHPICFRTPLGPHCCSEFDSICHECSENRCQQKCIQFRQEQKCMCDENYIGVTGTNNSKCVSKEQNSNLLIYSTNNEIGMINLRTNISHVIKNETEATSLTSAFDHLYFATYNNNKGRIYKILNASNEIHETITSNSKVTSLAVDWITNKIYYTTNASTINVCSENGDICKQLKSCNAHFIDVAPRFGLLFWVETRANENGSHSQYIMKSAMDGSDEKLLTSYGQTSWPIQISVDELTEKVYFWTRLTDLSFVSFDEKHKKIVVFDDLPAVFTVFERSVYFASHETNKIHAGDIKAKLFMASVLMTCHNSTSVTHLYAYNPKLQRTKISNPCVKSCPNSLCLLRPTSSRKTLNYTCVNDSLIRPHESSSATATESKSNPGTEKVTWIETTRAKDETKHNSGAEKNTPTKITRSQSETKLNSHTESNIQKSETKQNSEDERNKLIEKDDTKQNSGIKGYVLAVLIIIIVILLVVICVAAATMFYVYKRLFSQNDHSVATNIPLQPRVNNDILAGMADCSEFNKAEYKKNNYNKLECSTYDDKDVNYVG